MCKTKEVEALIGVVLAWLKTWEAILSRSSVGLVRLSLYPHQSLADPANVSALALTGPLQTMSDKYGRKPFLIGIPVVEVVGILALMLASTSHRLGATVDLLILIF